MFFRVTEARLLTVNIVKQLTLIIAVRDIVIGYSSSVRITSILSILVVSVLSVKSYVLLSSYRACHSLTLGRVLSHEVKRAYQGEGDGCKFVTICSTAVVDQGVLVVYAIR